MKAVLLAGGLGTRMREETEFRPKPMVEIGGKPILWHIMRNLAHYGITDFIIASGYKHQVINDYFLEHPEWTKQGSETGNSLFFTGIQDGLRWTVQVAYTGEETSTGGRVFRLRDQLRDAPFFVTYGDGLADVDIRRLLVKHESTHKLATLTAVQPSSRFGLMDIGADGIVESFREKPKMKDWVSIGYFVFEPEVLDYLDDSGGLEETGLTKLAQDRQLVAHKHKGFWLPMDTYREYMILNEMWESGDAPWKAY